MVGAEGLALLAECVTTSSGAGGRCNLQWKLVELVVEDVSSRGSDWWWSQKCF